MKVLEHLTDGLESGWHGRAYDVVRLLGELTARRLGSDRHRDNDWAGLAARTARTAASMLAPVAIPSSTRITV